jgi:hypothetical protein
LINGGSRASFAFDEFGPVVHEMREFDVRFDDNTIPVQHSNLYITNSAQIATIEYLSGPFGAKFLLANASRENAIVQGEDTLTFGPDNPVNHKMFVFGRAMYQEDDLSITKEDEESIRKNGLASLAFDNRFIQTEAMANDLAQWIIDLWKYDVDEVRLKVFGNSLVQLGDLVTVNFPPMNFTPTTHRYFVVGLNNEFTTGLETNLILSRARAADVFGS